MQGFEILRSTALLAVTIGAQTAVWNPPRAVAAIPGAGTSRGSPRETGVPGNRVLAPPSAVQPGLILERDAARGGFEPWFAVAGANHFRQRMTIWGVRQYGFAQARLELGRGLTLSAGATSGITLLGVGARRRVSLHLGIEPFSSRIRASSRDALSSHYEWMPMASLGLQAEAGSCRFLPLARAGAAVGTLGKGGFWPAFGSGYGAGAHLNCARFNLAFEIARIERRGARWSLATADALVAVDRRGSQAGLRLESVAPRADAASRVIRPELRAGVILSTSFFTRD